MKLSSKQVAEINHLSKVEGWSNYALSQKYEVHHSTIERALRPKDQPLDDIPQGSLEPAVPDMLAPFLPALKKIVDDEDKIRGPRVLELLKKKGFQGSINTVRRGLRALREKPRLQQAYTKREVLPGAEAQVDWAELGKLRFADEQMKVYLLVIVLSWSRDIYAHAFTDMKGPTLCRGHAYAFKHFGGIPSTCLYDNMKTVVIKTETKLACFNENFLSFATSYGFRLRNCNPRQPQEKGRVERAIRYMRESFFPLRDFLDLRDLNAQLHAWLKEVSRQRRWPDERKFSVGQQQEKEQDHLHPLPVELWFPKGHVECRVHKIPYVHFQTCKYSTPPALVGHMVRVVYDDETVEIWEANKMHASHKRSYRRGRYIECKQHVLELAKHHSRGFSSTKQSAIMRLVPESVEFFKAIKKKGMPTAQPTRFLFELLEVYGSERLNHALAAFKRSGSLHMDSLKRILKNQDPDPNLHTIAPHLLPSAIKAKTTIHQNLNQYSEPTK